jgi:Hemerythrin HHE cation binding domain
MDITELILFQHHQQRRAFALLDDIARDDADRLGSVWSRLEALLEVHAEAEERFFYPRLLAIGARGDDPKSVDSEVKDAIKDHNEIREGIRKVRRHKPGTGEWWAAVLETRTANGDHMAEEERDDLPDFCRDADLQTRHDVALQFIAYEAQHAEGIALRDKDPEAYVKESG